MKHISASRIPAHPTRTISSEASAGPEGFAITPPAYGIDAVDVKPEEAPQGQAPYEIVQMKAGVREAGNDAGKRPANRTGLPDALKAGIEALSGIGMEDVRVHYNSSKPAQLQALAYTQGSEIHLSPGQERHLPHEAWHVVQQKQGRVLPTLQMKGAPINADDGLEREADVMGAKALRMPGTDHTMGEASDKPADQVNQHDNANIMAISSPVVQRKIGFEYEIGQVSTTKTLLFGGRDKLKKKQRLLNGVGFTVEADEETTADPVYNAPTWQGYSDLEFVTSAFPVDTIGFNALASALNHIANIIGYIQSHPNTDIPAGHLPHGTAIPNRFVRYGGGQLRGKPQATVGLSLTALDRLFQDVSTAPLAPPMTPASPTQTVFGGNLDPGGMGAPMGGQANTTGLANIERARQASSAEITASLPVAHRSPALLGLVTLLVRYLVQGFDGSAGYGKLIAESFMLRTNFAIAFRELPSGPGSVQQFFSNHPTLFSTMVCRAARRIRPALDDNGQIFEGGIYNDNLKYGPASAEYKTPAQKAILSRSLTRRAWLKGIAEGRDLLTKNTFPTRSQAKRDEIESLGSYGPNMDVKPGPGGGNLPIIELRGLPSIHAGIFPSMALDLFQYVYILNNAIGGGMPGNMINLTVANRLDLAGLDTPQAIARRQAVIAQALAAVTLWGGGSGG